jgi:hypothetical protein
MKIVTRIPSLVMVALIAVVPVCAIGDSLPKANQLISFHDLHSLVNAKQLSWKDCKPGPDSHEVVSGGDFERYIAHKDMVGFPDNQLVSYAVAIKYATRTKCK